MKNWFIVLFLCVTLFVLFVTQQSDTKFNANSFVIFNNNKKNTSSVAVNNKTDNILLNVQQSNSNKYKGWQLTNKRTRRLESFVKTQKLMVDNEMKFLNHSMAIASTDFPIRSLILTMVRSGSSFTNEIVASHPGTFNYYEPLYKFDDNNVSKQKQTLKDLLECRIPKLYLKHLEKSEWLVRLFHYNYGLHNFCKAHNSSCTNLNFLESLCQQCPYVSMKVTRIRLRHLEELLKDDSLNLNIVYLVRDPRGTMTSRHKIKWCMTSRCGSYSKLCDDLEDDYYAAVKFTKFYPRKFRIIRYEDLSLNAFHEVPKLFDFLHLQFNNKSKNYLEEHMNATTRKVNDKFSTFRNSSVIPFSWRTQTNYTVIKELQEYCGPVLKKWGYLLAKNESHQHTFIPLLPEFKLKAT